MAEQRSIRDFVVQDQFREDLEHWIRTDSRTAVRVMELMEDVRRHPFEGKGQPEPLKHGLQGKWSRRVTEEHRLVYEVFPDRISFLTARYHYERAPAPPSMQASKPVASKPVGSKPRAIRARCR